MTGSAHRIIFQSVDQLRGENRGFAAHEIPALAVLHLPYHEIDPLLCILIDARNLDRVAQIEQGSPRIRHFHAEERVEGTAPLSHDIVSKSTGLPRRGPIGCSEPRITRVPIKHQPLQEIANYAGQTPGIRRADDADGAAICGKAISIFPDAVGYRDQRLSRCR